MPRRARKKSATQYYHVMVRGTNRSFLFREEREKRLYLELLKEQQAAERIAIVAWCLMDNHIHIVIKAELSELSNALKRVGIRYAANFNKCHDQIGTVFGDRFKSEVIEDDEYLLRVIRYIHNNPVKAGLAVTHWNYKWSSYREYTEAVKLIAVNQKDFVVSCYGGVAAFIRFHQVEDSIEYLELKDDLMKQQYDKCTEALREFLRKYNIENGQRLYKSKRLFGEVCHILVKENGLSLRKAANLLETHYSRVSRALQYYDAGNRTIS